MTKKTNYQEERERQTKIRELENCYWQLNNNFNLDNDEWANAPSKTGTNLSYLVYLINHNNNGETATWK